MTTGQQSNPLRTLRRHSDLRKFFFAGVVSDIGTWMQAVTVGSLVAASTNAAGSTALVMSALFLPQGLCAPIGGMLADRFDRRRLSIVLMVTQAITAAGLALMVGAGITSTLPLAAVVFLQGCGAALTQPTTQAMLPMLVPREELFAAISLGMVSWNAGRIVGPSLGAISASAWGAAPTIWVNAASYLAIAVVLLGMHRSFGGGGTVDLRRVRQEFLAAIAAMRKLPTVVSFMVLASLAQIMLVAPLIPTVPFFAQDVLGGGKGSVTALFTAFGIGGVAFTLVTPALVQRHGRGVVGASALVLAAVAMVATAQSRTLWLAAALIAIYAGATMSFFTSAGAVVQRDSPETHRGRMLSINGAVVGTTYGIFSPVHGWISDSTWGMRTHVTVCAVVVLVMVAGLAIARPGFLHSFDDP